MVQSLSDDLRNRVVADVERGSSRRAAAARFGVSVSSAIRWVERLHKTGSAAAKPQGGDRRSKRIEAYHAFLMEAVTARKDITLAELQVLLDARGAHFGIGTLWRFFDRHGITFKKRQRTPTSRTAQTS